MVTKEKRDGSLYLTINKISRLFDVAPVFTPAYVETTVNKRALDIISRMLEEDTEKHNNDDMKRNEEDLEKQEQEQENVPVDEQEKEQVEREEVNEDKEEKVNEENNENDSSDDEQKERSDEEEKEEENEEEKEEEQVERSLKNIKINNHINMKKTENFSLINAVRSLINKNDATDATKAVLALGEEQLMKRGGIVDNNTIYIPFNVAQRDITVTSLMISGLKTVSPPRGEGTAKAFPFFAW